YLLPTAVELVVGDPQIFEHAAVDDCFFDDPRDVGELDAAVPDGLRINHDGRTELALIEAAGRIGSHQRLEAAALDFFLEGLAQRLAAVSVTTAAAVARLAAVGANENVVRELGHPSILTCRFFWL